MKLWRPRTPHEKRMKDLVKMLPSKMPDSMFQRLKAAMEADIGFRMFLRNNMERLPSFLLIRDEGGSQFLLAETLRHFFREYFGRLSEGGPSALPTSFNVMEAFLRFRAEFSTFDLREECEHLLRLQDYLDWYTAGRFPENPSAMTEILPEGIIYSYHMVAPLEDFKIVTLDSELAISGACFVRHEGELTAMLVLGEYPPYPTDSDAAAHLAGIDELEIPPGKENIHPDKHYKISNRYLDEMPGFSKVIAMARFDLASHQYCVRDVHLDIGPSFLIVTDDPTGIRSVKVVEEMRKQLERYNPVFSALAAMMYLPAFFISEQPRVIESKFATQLQLRRGAKDVRKAAKHLGPELPFFRKIRCFAKDSIDVNSARYTVTPPPLAFATSGFFKPLPSGLIGRDKDGNPVVGRTWVERTDTWTAESLDTFLVHRDELNARGPDPGTIYVMRSGYHSTDVYKIGLTRRAPTERAGDLSSATGVPSAFEVLATWRTGDVAAVEREVHKKLRRYRVNNRREFFCLPIAMIISTINDIVGRTKA